MKEIVKHKPWAAAHGETLPAWDKVASGVRDALPTCTADGKAYRRQFAMLLDAFRREEMESLRASGTAEDFTEREQQLTDITSLVRDSRQNWKGKVRCGAALSSISRGRSRFDGRLGRAHSSDSDREAPSTPASKLPKRTSTEVIGDYLDTTAAAADLKKNS
ncbi:unnamed protein product [Phytophthora fragariaefolia]|uniref:Unnamed protein product n=1 Tax=Phytophthora fragariaefolia TaxID=1490495 RepID=A0A9W6Y2J4_9STRA|nr:unnamed protein product [Phytophthora fragariaefolia]